MASLQGLARVLRGLGACRGSSQSIWTSPIAAAPSCWAASSSFGAARGGVASTSAVASMASSSSSSVSSPGALFSSFSSSSRSFASSASPPVTGAASASVSEAAESDADEEESLEQIRSRIFGTAIGDGRPSGRKVLRKKLVGDVVASYYPDNPAAQDPLFVDLDDVK